MLTRGHWGIENGLQYRRDVTFHEDHAQLRMGHAPEMLAVLNNIVLGLFARQGETNMAHARRDFAYHLDKVLARYVPDDEHTWLHSSMLNALGCALSSIV